MSWKVLWVRGKSGSACWLCSLCDPTPDLADHMDGWMVIPFTVLFYFQVASFPFKGNTSFLVVMPLSNRGNLSYLLPKLNISDLYSRLPHEKTMQVNLPKVKLQYRQELQEALTSMGENFSATQRFLTQQLG